MKVVPLERGDLKQAAAVVARAFFDYPSLKAYFPDEKKRAWKLPWYMEHVLKTALRFGEAYTTEDRSGVLFLLTPGHTKLTNWEYVQSGFFAAPLVVGLKHYAFVDSCEVALAETQERLMKSRLHYYIWGITVDPARQRSGAGTALLQMLYDKADRENMPIYLETHKLANVAYYEQSGFQLIHAGTMPGDDMPFWSMVREPNPDKA